MDWYENKFDEIFDKVCKGLEWRIQHDNEFTIDSLENALQSLYIHQGNNWDGRGEVTELSIAASIAAHEHVLAELKAKS